MTQAQLHQVITAAVPGDAICDQTFLTQRWLRELGFVSEIYAGGIHDALKDRILPLENLRIAPNEHLIVRHSYEMPFIDHILSLGARLLLIYHNITPPRFLRESDPELARGAQQGLNQLPRLLASAAHAAADSQFNANDLAAFGARDVTVIPIALDNKAFDVEPAAHVLSAMAKRQPLLLFAGRIVTNKRQEDVIRLLYSLRRILPDAQLALVGVPWMQTYSRWLRGFVETLGLSNAVHFSGHVAQPEYVAYFKAARIYVSMSEHEGFGKPLIECMRSGLPILAYGAASVPETVGNAGMVFREKNFEAMAEAAALLIEDTPLRTRLIARGHARAQQFSNDAVRERFVAWIKACGLR
jgi:glycosyltransferase involved in cell wall biosynthesis